MKKFIFVFSLILLFPIFLAAEVDLQSAVIRGQDLEPVSIKKCKKRFRRCVRSLKSDSSKKSRKRCNRRKKSCLKKPAISNPVDPVDPDWCGIRFDVGPNTSTSGGEDYDRIFGNSDCKTLQESVTTCEDYSKQRNCLQAHQECFCYNGEVKEFDCRDYENLSYFDQTKCAAASAVYDDHPLYDQYLTENPFYSEARYAPDAICMEEEGQSPAAGLHHIGYFRCEQQERVRPEGFISCVQRHFLTNQIMFCSEIYENDPTKMQAYRDACSSSTQQLQEGVPCPQPDHFVIGCQKDEHDEQYDSYRYQGVFKYGNQLPYSFVEPFSPAYHSRIANDELGCIDTTKFFYSASPWTVIPEYYTNDDGEWRGHVNGPGTVIINYLPVY